MSDVDLLYETPDTGRLSINDRTGKAERTIESGPQQASLSGPGPSFKGIGGSSVPAAETPRELIVGGQKAQMAPRVQTRSMTPEELMAWADGLENEMLSKTESARQPHMSALEPALARSEGRDGPPDWLTQYMEKTPAMGQSFDGINWAKAKHQSEKEKLKAMKEQAQEAGLR